MPLQKPSVGDETTEVIYRSQVFETQLLKLLMIPVLNKIFLTLKRFDAHVPEHVVPHDARDVTTAFDVLQHLLDVMKEHLLCVDAVLRHPRLALCACANVRDLQYGTDII